MISAIATVSLSGTLESKLEAAARAGFDAVEIFENDLLASASTPKEIRSRMDDLGIRCALWQPFRDFEGLPAELRERVFDRAERKFDLMGILGADAILVCSSCSPAASGDRDRIVDDFRELGGRAAARGIMVGYEALAWGRFVNDHRQAWEIVREVDHPSVGIILDSFHSLARNIPSVSIREIDPNKIVFVQLADAPVLQMDLLYWSRHFRSLPGQGGLDVEGYTAEILRTGYKGPLSLEIFNDRFRAGSAQSVARDGFRSLEYVRDAAMRRLDTPIARMPAPQTVCGVEFVEFAVTPDEASQLSELFESLGFVEAGRHRAKAVTRWSQGDVNLVLNCEPDDFAGSYREMHGPSICAVGLRVADSASAVTRARHLGVSDFSQKGAPGDLEIAAIHGVGGSLVYLLDEGDQERIWNLEFTAGQDQVVAPNSLILAVDHLAAVVPIDEFLSWKLYWRSVFELEEQEALDVLDPLGLVQSQAIRSASGSFRVSLNTSDANRTLMARFLQQSSGAGFQHVAFLTEDIFATAEALATIGFPHLEISPNYYDDLTARFGFSAAHIDRMRRLGILYDIDASGREFWHLYSRAYQKRVFFEFVQRDGYDGYGAANTGIRLGAQNLFRDQDGLLKTTDPSQPH